ncbi:MAG: 4Fe-4S dicluster domain-containing protein [Acidobacteria bacterium]|nr:4Fe-4S dicluster domain-containing protein [Acidobacteriota bacterium]
MGYRLETHLDKDLAPFGGETFNKCFNCGNCTAVCGLSKEDTTFPRRYIRYMQLGLKDKMMESIDPWLCYYCGDCSDTCPREAEPGELMMSSRRWLTSLYDWTGLSRLMYRNNYMHVLLMTVMALLVFLAFIVPSNFGFGLLAQHPEAMETVMLEKFTPVETVHLADWLLAALVSFFLLSNAGRMVYKVMKGQKASLSAFLTQLPRLIIHGVSQKRWKECDKDVWKNWIRHIFLVTGYATMFLLVVVFLQDFQVNDSSVHFTSYFGYYATAALLFVTMWMMIDRLRMREQSAKKSHATDWSFLILLFLVALTGILMHLFRINNWPMGTYTMYMLHLMADAPLILLVVPFGKWSHLIYRPIAVYLQAVKEKAREQRVGAPSLVTG